MLQFGAAAYVLHTFALTFLIAAVALWFVGVETRGRTLEEITREGGVPARA
jgi:heme exporter protein D